MNPLNDKFDILLDDLTEDVYSRYSNDREMEHQVGRLLNMNKIVKEIKDNNTPGDFIEFGVHQGFSLMWLARLRDLHGLNDKKIIGVDSFEGLPISSGFWQKACFDDTSNDVVKQTLQSNLTDTQCQNITIIKSWFDEPTLFDKLQVESDSLSLIHMDCDLKVSLRSAFLLIEKYLAGTQYVLFDDWGICDEEIPTGFREWKDTHPYSKSKIYDTNITRYYKVETESKL
jgi:O-methyltransferase